jgi:hypothetical protein
MKASLNLCRYVEDIINRTNGYLILFNPFYQLAINPSLEEHRDIVELLRGRTAGRRRLLWNTTSEAH